MGKRKTKQPSDLDVTESVEMTHSTPHNTPPSTLTRMSPKPIPAPTYDGTTDVDEFLEQFDAISEHNGWSSDENKLRLKLALKGSVSLGVSAVTYPEMCRQLKQQYAPSMDTATALLKAVKRQASENIYQFTQRLRKLVVTALPSLTEEQREEQVKREIITSVPSGSQLAWTLKLAPPQTVEETVEVIHKFNEFNGGQTKLNRVEADDIIELKKDLEQQAALQRTNQEEMFKQFASLQSGLMEQILATQTQMAATQQEVMSQLAAAKSSDHRDIRCYNCNGRGHFARECKKPKRGAGNANVQSS